MCELGGLRERVAAAERACSHERAAAAGAAAAREAAERAKEAAEREKEALQAQKNAVEEELEELQRVLADRCGCVVSAEGVSGQGFGLGADAWCVSVVQRMLSAGKPFSPTWQDCIAMIEYIRRHGGGGRERRWKGGGGGRSRVGKESI